MCGQGSSLQGVSSVEIQSDGASLHGWRDAGKQRPKAEVLAFIEEVWVDMRPLSLRLAMEGRKPDAG